jgi:hypothetical protein
MVQVGVTSTSFLGADFAVIFSADGRTCRCSRLQFDVDWPLFFFLFHNTEYLEAVNNLIF